METSHVRPLFPVTIIEARPDICVLVCFLPGYYTWSPTSVAQAQTFNMSFVPMLWGKDQSSLFKALADKDFEGSFLTEHKDVLAFNEPNLEEQSNLSPQEAADLWNEVRLTSLMPSPSALLADLLGLDAVSPTAQGSGLSSGRTRHDISA